MANAPDRAEHRIHVYSDPNEDLEDDLLPEYDFSKVKSLPNPYAERARKRRAAAQEAEAKEAENQSSSEGW